MLALIRKREVRAHLLRVPTEELSAEKLDAYPALVEAAKRAGASYSVTAGGDSDALVPMSLVNDALPLRTRMTECLAYNLEGINEVENQLAAIRRGTGYADLADDLAGLQTLYVEHVVELRGDGRKYRASDEADAGRLASEIRVARTKGQRPSTKAAASTWAEAFAALRLVHDDMIDAGRYLDRKNPKLAARWQSLHAKVGAAKRKKK